jgi:hypothetical protein
MRSHSFASQKSTLLYSKWWKHRGEFFQQQKKFAYWRTNTPKNSRKNIYRASEVPTTSAKALDLLRFVTFWPSHSPETGSQEWRVGGGGRLRENVLHYRRQSKNVVRLIIVFSGILCERQKPPFVKLNPLSGGPRSNRTYCSIFKGQQLKA